MYGGRRPAHPRAMKLRMGIVAFLLALLASVAATASPLGPDGAPGQRFPGKFIWYDLATENPEGARAFYGAVFGWKFRDANEAAAPYTLIENDGVKIGGMFKHTRPPGGKVGARWLSMLSVNDAARAAQVVRKSGGQVVLAPANFKGRGVHAVFRDPQGAVFGVLATEGGDPPDTPVIDGDVFWLDLFTTDPEKAAAFYAELAGYEVAVGDVAGRTRTLLASRGIARAGVTHLPRGADRPGWLPYILVDDVPGTLARVRSSGGKVLMEPQPGVLDGNLAVIADREGGVLGVVNWTAREGTR